MKKILLLTITFIFLITPLVFAKSNFPSKNDIYWLSQNIYHEARGENFYGKFMVGLVTLERVYSGKWGHTVKSVVTAPHQFSWYHHNKKYKVNNNDSWKMSQYAALFTLSIYPKSSHSGIMFYHNKHVNPLWASKMTKVAVIGNHIFYKEVN